MVGNPAMRWLGLRSYSFYLWHWPVLELTRPGIDVPLHGPVLFALQLGATIAARRPLLPLRGAALPPLEQLAAAGLAAHRPRRDRGRRDAVVLVVGWSGIVPQGPPRPAARRLCADHPDDRLDPAGGRIPSDLGHQGGLGSVRRPGPGQGPRQTSRWRGQSRSPVLALGDSVMVDARSGLARLLGPKLTLNAAVGRQPAEIISLLHDYARAGKVPDNVVLQLGNNGPVYSDDLEKLHAALRGVPHVYLVNVEVPRSWQGEVNSALSEAARQLGTGPAGGLARDRLLARWHHDRRHSPDREGDRALFAPGRRVGPDRRSARHRRSGPARPAPRRSAGSRGRSPRRSSGRSGAWRERAPAPRSRRTPAPRSRRRSRAVGALRQGRVISGTPVVLELAMGTPPIDLAAGGLRRVEGLALPPGHHPVEALHVAASAVGVVVRIRRPELVGPQHPPAPAQVVGHRQAEGSRASVRRRHAEGGPAAPVVGDPGVALELADAPGIE